tara:strand:+ start:1415 stop:2182 length:768 start_codon:yes stop_codon:yes gene_type:complete
VFRFILLLIGISYSQNIFICDSLTKTPLGSVNIYTSTYGITTDSNGFCQINLFKPEDLITISYIGYEKKILLKSSIIDTMFLNTISIPQELVSVLGINTKKRRKWFTKLERDVIRVYPYAKMTAKLIKNYSTVLDSVNNLSFFTKRKEKKIIFKKIESQLISRYGKRVTKLKRSQGRILIRLIDRETGYTSYEIIKEFRGLFPAGFWQITARFFSHNLKSRYNPYKGEDKMIEHIIKTIFPKNPQRNNRFNLQEN